MRSTLVSRCIPSRRCVTCSPRRIRQCRLDSVAVRSLLQRRRRSLSSTSDGQGRSNDPKQIQEDYSYCVNVVRERDREGFLCGLLMPQKAQKPYFAIRALNVEIASVKESQMPFRGGGGPAAGRPPPQQASVALHLRMQWWRDALKEIYGDRKGSNNGSSDDPLTVHSISCWHSPIVRALHAAHQQVDFTRPFLERLIEARERDLDVHQHDTMEQAVHYAEESVSSLLYLSLECAGVRDDDADTVASHAGVGIGLTTALRATPFRLMQTGDVAIPGNLLPPTFPYHQLMESALAEGEGSATDSLDEAYAKLLKEAVEKMAMAASSHLAEARARQGSVPRKARPCLLPVVPALHFLSRLESSNFDLFDPQLLGSSSSGDKQQSRHQLKLMLLLGRTWLTGIF